MTKSTARPDWAIEAEHGRAAKVEGRKVDGLKGDDAFIEHVEVGI